MFSGDGEVQDHFPSLYALTLKCFKQSRGGVNLNWTHFGRHLFLRILPRFPLPFSLPFNNVLKEIPDNTASVPNQIAQFVCINANFFFLLFFSASRNLLPISHVCTEDGEKPMVLLPFMAWGNLKLFLRQCKLAEANNPQVRGPLLEARVL